MSDYLIINIFIFVIGLILGSFYNVLALRTLKKEKISMPPSHCTICNHKLNAFDLFPVFSYIFLRGRCRYCKSKISAIYPFGELLTAISYVIIINKFGFSLEALIHIVFITIMILSTVTDIKEHIVPDKFIIVGIIIISVLRLFYAKDLLFYFTGGIGSFLVLLLILIISKGKMGGADVKLYGLIGLNIGFMNAILSLFYASILALIINISMLFSMDKENPKEIPFVPYITIGVLITYFIDSYKYITFI